MASEYQPLPIETDPDIFIQGAYDFMETKSPGWEPSNGQLDVWILLAIARMAALVRDLAAAVPPGLFRQVGKQLFSFPSIDETAATSTVTIQARDSAGHTAPAGTLFGIRQGPDLVIFETIFDATIPALSTTVGGVVIQAVEEFAGVVGTGLGTAGTLLENVDSLDWIGSITLGGTTGGGVDEETDDEYQNRLVAWLRLQAPRPILPDDFAQMAKTIPGIYRATAVDLYDPTTGLYNSERAVTVFAIGPTGLGIDGPTAATAEAYLRSLREASFLAYVRSATVTPVDVQYTVRGWPRYTNAEILSDANAAVASALNALTFGQPDSGDLDIWYDQAKVKVNDLIVAIGRKASINDVVDVKIRIGAAAYAATDVTLPGPGGVPSLGVVTPTVVA